MENRRRSRSRKGCRRNRRQMGGNIGQSYTLGGPLVPSNPSIGAIVSPFSSCGNAVAPGYIQGAQLRGGLPGFAGGSRKQKGGMYGHPASSFQVLGPNAIAVMQNPYGGCGEGAYSVPNALNQHGVSTITAPPSTYKGGRRSRKNRKYYGGAAVQLGTAPVSGMVYEVPRAGYTGVPSNASGGSNLADGKTPFLVSQPYASQPTASPACLKTGGSRKNRKNSRKNRKNSRKNRK